ncbi:hypothetical protein BS50DRAFT_257651 [Corynespora cassiicola Philippines]|uniref:Uncharacterized protein n=1 Tax=Corynespora cassiicola Philippines TaxID=1448308 RepID=A0A2T2P4P4_CORCC|nr:hypothetical protein BS50DRAFT_257651 [Corynespora cassiicola Philippines]
MPPPSARFVEAARPTEPRCSDARDEVHRTNKNKQVASLGRTRNHDLKKLYLCGTLAPSLLAYSYLFLTSYLPYTVLEGRERSRSILLRT